MATQSDKLPEHYSNTRDKYNSVGKIELEEISNESEDFIDSKTRIPLTNTNNLAQNIIQTIKTETFDSEEIGEDINDTENVSGLEKLEIAKVEVCVEDNDLMFEEDPLVGGDETHAESVVNESHSTHKACSNQEIFCKDCNKKIRVVIPIKVTPFICDICGKPFVQQSSLKRHKMSHYDIRPYSCNTCGSCFKTKSVLLRHQIVHSDDRPFHCNLCDSKFKYQNHLKLHKLRHDNIKPMCEVCGKRYYDTTTLKRHKKIHDPQEGLFGQDVGNYSNGK